MSETTTASTQDPGETRTARKRRAILDAATTLFLREGYLATSMDQIAAAASVSKQTVYKQFADKQSLFREIVTGTVAEVSDPVSEQAVSQACRVALRPGGLPSRTWPARCSPR